MTDSYEDSAASGFDAIIEAWRSATGAPVDEGRQSGFRAYRRDLPAGSAWVLEHNGEVIEMADSIETLLADHPKAHIHFVDPPPLHTG